MPPKKSPVSSAVTLSRGAGASSLSGSPGVVKRNKIIQNDSEDQTEQQTVVVFSNPSLNSFVKIDFTQDEFTKIICEKIASKWESDEYLNSMIRPFGVYAVYGDPGYPNSLELYYTVRDDSTPADTNVGNGVFVLIGMTSENKNNTFAIVKSKCRFVNVNVSGGGAASSNTGYYIITPSVTDIETERSPIRAISGGTIKTFTQRERIAVERLTGFITVL